MVERTTTPAAVTWLTEARADVRGALAAWDRGDLAPVPVGHAWAVVRLPQRLGWLTIRRLRATGAPLGPVLHTETHVLVLIPPAAAGSWYAPQTTTLGRGDYIAAPDPAVTAPRTTRARSWIVAPTHPLLLTDPGDLHTAYQAACEALKGAAT
ncbi:hypothetical protein [Streptomyces sp. YIM 121038]|uniref:hypothetical protein n=1 Tax=Streptomyces sp. YIM 121038 TaxID=2136401 RepID=UPI001110E116|nr:hypothetical protein [Streptomyces sp. YIM 121038]